MSAGDFIWGVAMIAGGVFIGIYGELLFRFVLAMIGFLAGFTALYQVLESQSDTARILISIVAGGIGAILLYSLFNLGLYVAGGALGAVLGLVIAALIGLGGSENGWLTTILVLAGAGGSGFFGPRLGSMIIPLGTSAVAAFMAVYGYVVLFQSTYGLDASNPDDSYSRRSLLVLFAIFFSFAFLGQWNISKLRSRLLRK
jgi:hypothetical protein